MISSIELRMKGGCEGGWKGGGKGGGKGVRNFGHFGKMAGDKGLHS